MHVSITIADNEHSFTFLTNNVEHLTSMLQLECSSLCLPKSYHVVYECDIEISQRKMPHLYKACVSSFKHTSFLRWNGFIPMMGDIHTISVANNIMLDAGTYPATTDFERFLVTHDILKSYYKRHLVFKINQEAHEYISGGHRQFQDSFEASVLNNEAVLKGHRYETHSSVHRTQHYLYVESIHGVDDTGIPVNITFKTPF